MRRKGWIITAPLQRILMAAAFVWVARAQAESNTDLEGKGYTCGKIAGGTTLEITSCQKCETNLITGTVTCTIYCYDKNGQNCNKALNLEPVAGVGDVNGDHNNKGGKQ